LIKIVGTVIHNPKWVIKINGLVKLWFKKSWYSRYRIFLIEWIAWITTRSWFFIIKSITKILEICGKLLDWLANKFHHKTRWFLPLHKILFEWNDDNFLIVLFLYLWHDDDGYDDCDDAASGDASDNQQIQIHPHISIIFHLIYFLKGGTLI